MKRLVADNNEELYLKIKEFINKTMKSVIGETVTTSNGYDSQNNRFIYLNGKYLEGNCQDHMELFEQLSQKIGYDNFQQFCEQNPDAQFVTGKVKNGVAIIETSSGKVDANANINDVISVLKKNGIKKYIQTLIWVMTRSLNV